MKTHTRFFRLKPAAAAVLLALCAPTAAHAFEIKNQAGEVIGSFDTTISLGASWRMSSRDPALVSIANGGTNRDPNGDDGNLNYDKNDLISAAVKATHEIDLKRGNLGFFGRVSYFYDEAVMSKAALDSSAKEVAGRDLEVLDAYVRGAFEVGGRNLNIRAGKQVVSWGESTFILNGINVTNPVNVSKLRVAGAELKEGLIPSGMIWASQELSDRFTVEGYYQTHFNKTKIDPRGTFFSTNDFVADGAGPAFTGFGRRNDSHGAAGVFPSNSTAQLIAPRSADRMPGDGNQFGLAFRAFAKELNNTEFGLYFLNYHSRVPFVSGFRGGVTAAGGTIIPGCSVFDAPTFGAIFTGPNAGPATTAACTVAGGRAGTYFVEFPKNIRLYGLSFNTQGPAGIALQGEYSYRPNQPLQLPSAELLGAALGTANQLTSTSPAAAAGVAYGTEISGYRRVQMHQVQVTGTKAFGPTFGAEQLAVVAEVGATYLNLPSGLKFAGPGVHLPQPGSSTSSAFGSTSTEGFMTTGSWGYRLLARLDYPNAIGPATLSPRVAFSHDVQGVSPTFNQGTKAATFGLTLNYKQNWQAEIAYTTFWGGRTYAGTDPVTSPLAGFPAGQSPSYASSANPLKDRDFLSVSVSYAF